MNIEKVKTAVDNINEEYLLDAAELISGKDVNMKNKKEANVNEVTLVEVQEKKSIGKVAKWLSVAAVFSFIVAGVTLIGITANNNQIGTSGVAPLDSKVESSETEKPSIENVISSVEESSVEEKTEEELLWEKAVAEASAQSNTRYISDGGYLFDDQLFTMGEEIGHVEYKGGMYTIKGDFYADCGKDIPENASVGYYVTINGVVQELFVDGKSIGTMYVHSNTKEELENGTAKGSLNVSFAPTISKTDEDKDELLVRLMIVKNPEFRVVPAFSSAQLNHMSETIGLWKLDVGNTPIENVIEAKAVNYETTDNDEPSSNQGARISGVNVSGLNIKIDGTSVKLNTQLRTGEEERIYRYRLVYLVNGAPVTLSDGTPFIEIDVEPCKQYDFDVITIDNVQPYDTVEVIGFTMFEGDVSAYFDSTFMHYTIYPEDFVAIEQ